MWNKPAHFGRGPGHKKILVRRRDALSIGYGQNIVGFGSLTILIGNTFTSLFSDGMRAIKIQVAAVKFILY